MAEAVLQIKNLTVQYVTQDGVVTALDDFSLDVAPGEIVGLVGESGSGKSTVGLAIMRLIPAPGRITGGQIILDGQNLLALNERGMRAVRGRLVGMIFQDALAALDPTMKLGKQLMEALQVHHGLGAAAARRRAIELLAMVGIPSPERRINNYPHQFSGGMRQRVMIAMAISCRPKLLIADEATTALDVTIQRQILDLIATLRDEIGAAVIFITHDVAVVAQLCDRVVVMYAAREAESGPTKDVLLSPKHPYTIGLLGATPHVAQGKAGVLKPIPGMPPELIDMPDCCPFWPRCPRQTEVCRTHMPPLFAVGVGHRAACWHMEEA